MAKESVIEQLKALDEQRATLLNEAKATALATAEASVAELNELGFNYRLVEGGTAPTVHVPRAPRAQGTGTRRSGIRDDVYDTIKAAGADGTTPSAIREALGIIDGDKSGYQSVANALSALKKASKIGDKAGKYVAA